nr:TolC family protein [uncultured Holophaga sp.]
MPPFRLLPILLVSYSLVAQEATPISLRRAIELSLGNNLQVQIARETREINGRATETAARGTFDWTLNGSLALGYADTTSTSISSKSDPILVTTEASTRTRNLEAGVSKLFEWGGTFTAKYAPDYTNSTGTYTYSGASYPFGTARPYSGSLSASYTQSLLRNFGREATAATLLVAQKGTLIADYAYQQTIIELVASTEAAYWDVVYAERNLENKRLSLALAQKQLKENRIRVEVGTLAPIEVTSAEATVALREQDIISAEAQVFNAKDALTRILYAQAERPGDIRTTDAPSLSHIGLDEAAAVKMALDRRVELKEAQLTVDSKRILERAAANRTRPQLDAYVAYNGASDSYGSLSSMNSDLTGFKNPGYQVGLQFSMPLGNHAAAGALSQARAAARSSELSRRDAELGIVLEVRTAIRNVEAAEKGVKAAEKTRIFRERDLEAEQKKFDNGMSTNFLVLSKQNDLDTARASEIQSQIAYAKAASAFEKAVGNLLDARIPGVRFQ